MDVALFDGEGILVIGIIVALILIGLVLWAIEQLPLDPTIKTIIRVFVVVIAVLYVLQSFGLIHTGVRL